MRGVKRLAVVKLEVRRERQHEKPIDGRDGEPTRLIGVGSGATEGTELVDRRRRGAHGLFFARVLKLALTTTWSLLNRRMSSRPYFLMSLTG